MGPTKNTEEMTQLNVNIPLKYTYKRYVISSGDNLKTYTPTIQIEYKKRRNQMKHLIPKKKKRK